MTRFQHVGYCMDLDDQIVGVYVCVRCGVLATYESSQVHQEWHDHVDELEAQR